MSHCFAPPYDALGNIHQKVLGARTVDLVYGGSNRLQQMRDDAVSSSWKGYSYDARGNVIGNGSLTFSYDLSNQPTAIAGAASAAYQYDGHFRRVKG